MAVKYYCDQCEEEMPGKYSEPGANSHFYVYDKKKPSNVKIEVILRFNNSPEHKKIFCEKCIKEMIANSERK